MDEFLVKCPDCEGQGFFKNPAWPESECDLCNHAGILTKNAHEELWLVQFLITSGVWRTYRLHGGGIFDSLESAIKSVSSFRSTLLLRIYNPFTKESVPVELFG